MWHTGGSCTRPSKPYTLHHLRNPCVRPANNYLKESEEPPRDPWEAKGSLQSQGELGENMVSNYRFSKAFEIATPSSIREWCT